MVLNIRRSGKLIEVPIELEYMGVYSDTTPWDCKKSSRIVEKAEAYMRNGMRPKTGMPNDDDYAYGPWNDNVLFLLASGNPKLQGLVRRYIRKKMDALDALKGGDKRAYNSYNGWGNAYLSLLFGEYYHRTGDSTVLPRFEYLVHKTQSGLIEIREADPGKWPPTGPSGYGTHPAAEMPKAMGMVLAKEAGVKVDQHVLDYALKHLHHKRAEHGWILYNGYGPFLVESRQIDAPQPIDPALKAAGRLSSMNGKLGTGAALFSLLDGHDKAVRNCSEHCVSAFNRTRSGHGGAWFNNYWTPIGAYHAGKEKYQHFMKGQQWWRELYRDHSGAVWQAHNAKEKKSVLAVGFVTHRVLHHKRLRIFGAPRSVFGPDAPAYLKEALAAHRKRDYALAEKRIQGCLEKRDIPAVELPRVRHFLDSVQTLKKSVEYDLSYTEKLLEQGEFYLAGLELPQLKMVVSPKNPRLAAIAATLESDKAKAKIAAVLNEAKKEESRRRAELKAKKTHQPTNAPGEWTDDTTRLVTLVKDGACTFTHSRKRRASTYPEDQWSRWRLAVFESRSHTPEKWQQPDYDDSSWEEITLPTTWRPGHTALMRTTFEVKDATAFDGLQVRVYVYKQNDLKIYLNGEVVAKVNYMGKQHMLNLTPYATTLLKKGVNTLAVSAEHGMRWVDFSFRLEARLKSNSETDK